MWRRNERLLHLLSGRYQGRPGGEPEHLNPPSSSEKHLHSSVNRGQVKNLDFSSQLALIRHYSFTHSLARNMSEKVSEHEGLNKVYNKIGPKSRFQ